MGTAVASNFTLALSPSVAGGVNAAEVHEMTIGAVVVIVPVEVASALASVTDVAVIVTGSDGTLEGEVNFIVATSPTVVPAVKVPHAFAVVLPQLNDQITPALGLVSLLTTAVSVILRAAPVGVA